MLDYLFVAEFEDGHVLEQTPEDRSLTCPGKSAMHDVRTGGPLARFALLGFGGEVASVDVARGVFKVEGDAVAPGSSLPDGFEWVDLRPGEEAHGPYFRRVSQDFGADLRPVGPARVRYCVGVPGKNPFLAIG